MLETKISLFFICDNSCARTPSNSSLFKSFKIPVVTATFAFFGFLPVANAFGWSLLITYSSGIGIFSFCMRWEII